MYIAYSISFMLQFSVLAKFFTEDTQALILKYVKHYLHCKNPLY